MGAVTNSKPRERKKIEKEVTINTLQYSAYVRRLSNYKSISKGIWLYDFDNLYPNKVRATWQRSASAKSASKVFSKFIAGEGFDFDDIEINEISSWQILRFIANEISVFDGFSLHVDYNIFGEKTGYTLVPFEFCRLSVDFDKIIVNPYWDEQNFSYYQRTKDRKEYYIFNDDPAIVQQQIEESGGIEEYPGQVFYYKNTVRDVYTTAYCDSVLDDMQLENEIGVYNLSNIQNNYPISAIVKLFANMKDAKEQIELQQQFTGGRGARNAGKLLIVDGLPIMDKDFKMIEQLSRENIDNLFKFQKESARDDIFGCYALDPILAGIHKGTFLGSQKYKEAFDIYNSETETYRKDIANVLKIIFRNSIFEIPEEFEILPRQLMIERDNDNGNFTDNNSAV